MRILIVEDEIASREKLRKILQDYGECCTVEGGWDAVIAFTDALQRGEPFSLITLDITMPDMDGKEIVRIIRERERHLPAGKRAKVVMATAHVDKDNLLGSVKAGCDDYIVKPFTRQIIEEKLRKLGLLKGTAAMANDTQRRE
ncbi:MAG: response regulator [Alphaproteobacteria bacterium]|uniref:Response regulator n=1 Tax=Candidatus Nitrobium versatile TaxID=2884831 RepID=A0A953JAS2_9BACT|nr:response regulator [Candidatus Nitrobium versatile]